MSANYNGGGGFMSFLGISSHYTQMIVSDPKLSEPLCKDLSRYKDLKKDTLFSVENKLKMILSGIESGKIYDFDQICKLREECWRVQDIVKERISNLKQEKESNTCFSCFFSLFFSPNKEDLSKKNTADRIIDLVDRICGSNEKHIGSKKNKCEGVFELGLSEKVRGK